MKILNLRSARTSNLTEDIVVYNQNTKEFTVRSGYSFERDITFKFRYVECLPAGEGPGSFKLDYMVDITFTSADEPVDQSQIRTDITKLSRDIITEVLKEFLE